MKSLLLVLFTNDGKVGALVYEIIGNPAILFLLLFLFVDPGTAHEFLMDKK